MTEHQEVIHGEDCGCGCQSGNVRGLGRFFDFCCRHVTGVVRLLFVCCVGLFISDLLIAKDHVHFAWEKWLGFYAVYGFVACVLLVLIAKYVLRPLVIRDEDYYD